METHLDSERRHVPKRCLEESERVDDGQSHVSSEHKPHWTSRTTESEKLQTANEDEWNTTRGPPRDVCSLPKSSWQAFGDSKIWKHTRSQESAVFWEPLGAPLLPKTRVRNFIHPKQFGIFPKRLSLPSCQEEHFNSDVPNRLTEHKKAQYL